MEEVDDEEEQGSTFGSCVGVFLRRRSEKMKNEKMKEMMKNKEK